LSLQLNLLTSLVALAARGLGIGDGFFAHVQGSGVQIQLFGEGLAFAGQVSMRHNDP
jgi:hypothetical protein